MTDSKWNGVIWEGIYDTWEEAELESSGSGFSSERWITAARKKLLAYRKNRLIETTQSPIDNRFSSLPLLIATEIKNNQDKLCVLDFGGGLGTHYELLKSALCDYSMLSYHVIETQETAEEGRKLFNDNEKIIFHSKFPDTSLCPLVCYSNSALQYIDDWLGVIKKMTDRKPRYLLLDDIPAGNIDNFISLQNYYTSKIPHRFFNINTVVDSIHELGYDLSYKTRYFGEVLGGFSPWPMDNFITSHRLDNSCSLLFKIQLE